VQEPTTSFLSFLKICQEFLPYPLHGWFSGHPTLDLNATVAVEIAVGELEAIGKNMQAGAPWPHIQFLKIALNFHTKPG
jgi:hypothetical protein